MASEESQHLCLVSEQRASFGLGGSQAWPYLRISFVASQCPGGIPSYDIRVFRNRTLLCSQVENHWSVSLVDLGSALGFSVAVLPLAGRGSRAAPAHSSVQMQSVTLD